MKDEENINDTFIYPMCVYVHVERETSSLDYE